MSALRVVLACLAGMVFVEPASGATIRSIYFSNGSIPSGQMVRNEGQLPGETKVFEVGRDKVARMFVILGDFYAHTFRGELKAADGTVAKKLNWHLPSMTNPAASWRFSSWGFNLEGLAPGEYKIEIVVDDAPAGTYGFTLK